MADDSIISTPPAAASTSTDPEPISIKSGMEVDETQIKWTLTNLDIVLKDDCLIRSQMMDISAGERISRPTKWSFRLQVSTKGGSRYVGLVRTLVEPTATNVPSDLFSEVSVEAKGSQTDTRWTYCGLNKCIGGQPMGCGNMEMINVDSWKELTAEISIKLRLFRIAETVKPMTEIVAEFKEKLNATLASQDMQEALSHPPRLHNKIKLISRDNVEFIVQKGVLALRSPAMLGGLKRKRAHKSVIRLSAVSSTTLEVLLPFIVECKLHDSWRSVLVELTKAAGAYQYPDLLKFLDLAIGRNCDVRNAGQLLKLANQLELKTAQEEVFEFIKKNMTGSVEDFLKVFEEAPPPSIEDVAPVEPQEMGSAAGPSRPWTNLRGHGLAPKRKAGPE